MKRFLFIPVILTVLLLTGCAAHVSLEPTGKGNYAANLSVGGPVVEAFDTRIPVPYAAAGLQYGLSDRVDLTGSLHLLPLFYKLSGFDVGAAWFPVLNEGLVPTVGIQPRLLSFVSLKADVPERWKVYPVVSGSAAWKAGGGLLYAGADIAVPLSRSDYDDDAAAVLFSPFLGYRWEIGERLSLFTELKWQGANVRSDQLAVEYLPIGGNGAVSTLFSIQRSF